MVQHAKYWFLLLFTFYSTVMLAQDTLLVEPPISANNSERLNSLIRDADTSAYIPIKLRFLLEALKFVETSRDPELSYELNSRIGRIYVDEKLNERALTYFKHAEQHLAGKPNPIELDLEIASVYDQLGKADSASMYYRRVLTNYEQKNNYKGQLKIHQALVATFLNNREYQKALTENFKVRQLVVSANDITHLPIVNNNIGYNFNYLKDYQKAVEYFQYAEAANEKSKQLDLTILYTNIGIAFNNTGELQKSLTYLQRAKNTLNKNERRTASYLDHLIARIYLNNQDLYNAKLFIEATLKNAEQLNQNDVLTEAYNTAALIYQGLYDYELALDHYKRHLALRDSFRLEERLRQEKLIQQQFLLERSEKEIRLLLANQEVQTLRINELELVNQKNELEKAKQASEIEALNKAREARIAQLKNTQLEADKAQQKAQLVEKELEAERRDRTISQLETDQKLSQAEIALKEKEIAVKNAEAKEKQRQNELLKAKADLNEAEIERQNSRLKFSLLVGFLLLLLAVLALISFLNSKKKNKQLASKNVEIAKSRDIIKVEKEKSETLLLNILPKETAAELKESGSATPKSYEKVTILFTDFSGFTRISRHMPPEDLIAELNECFKKFDEIVNRFGLEKIKTLGDGYMAAGGIPVPNESNPVDAINAALKINAFMIERSNKKRAAGIKYWDTRIGLHTGRVVAGVIGSRKFAYDIWGDAVNTASRMESGGEIGRVNISDDTYHLVKDHFNCTYRGEIEIKNRGKIGMYFVEESV